MVGLCKWGGKILRFDQDDRLFSCLPLTREGDNEVVEGEKPI